MNNKNRFEHLRGYYNNGYNPQGQSNHLTVQQMLEKIDFSDVDHFLHWYQKLDNIKELKKDWCPGDCCQSLLKNLVREATIMKNQKQRS